MLATHVAPFARAVSPVAIGMPQLGPDGLSENWLLRHLGDLHWKMICDGLGRRSRDMVDQQGNRLYASFVRVRWHSTVPLSGYRESDELESRISMSRCGDGVFISTAELTGSEGGIISAQLASMFTRRESTTNDRLVASAPPMVNACPIPDLDVMPPFVEEHRRLRTGKTVEHSFMSFKFDTTAPGDDTAAYQINGYQDFNGANLLYFASYPTIADLCASRTLYVAEHFGFQAFVSQASPIGRDIFYFGNANLGDSILCQFRFREENFAGLLAARVDMVRRESGTLIGRQFVVRRLP
jgi:probable biosynthetic protein (TIGR04098 family)